MSGTIGQFVHEHTGGRGFVFVIMAYEHAQTGLLYQQFKLIVETEFGLACLRADDVKLSGHDLLDKIHHLIERADLIIAEISERARNHFSPNVFYEVGYAVARGKSILLLAHSRTKIPTDLQGLESIRYGNARHELEEFDREFRRHLRSRLGTRVALLRDMLIANDPLPSLIFASPKYPGKWSKIEGQRYDRQTFGDNLGIVGLLSAFGSVLGEMAIPELVSADFYEEKLKEEEVNLYLIGSKKVNRLCGEMLSQIQEKRRGPGWYLGRRPEAKEKGDYPVLLYGNIRGYEGPIDGEKAPFGEDKSMVHIVDYGIVVRAPHPKHFNRLVVIMAGAHSLGTGAACIAATRSQQIERIRVALGTDKDALGDKQTAIWALVKGTADSHGMLGDDGVEIVEAGVYKKK